MQTKAITIRIDQQIYDSILECYDGKNFQEKARQYIGSYYWNKQRLQELKEEYQLKIKQIDKHLKNNFFENKTLISQQERTMLLETNELLIKRPEILIARKDLYNGEFNKNISLTDFKLLLYEIKEGKVWILCPPDLLDRFDLIFPIFDIEKD